jgi:hypothetical protein
MHGHTVLKFCEKVKPCNQYFSFYPQIIQRNQNLHLPILNRVKDRNKQRINNLIFISLAAVTENTVTCLWNAMVTYCVLFTYLIKRHVQRMRHPS